LSQQAQQLFELKPVLPDFYNILLERPRHDPRGYGLLYVDASMKANMGSSCSHSCNANCSSAVGESLFVVVVFVCFRRYWIHFSNCHLRPLQFFYAVARNGKLVIVLTTNRHVHLGEELTMDYYRLGQLMVSKFTLTFYSIPHSLPVLFSSFARPVSIYASSSFSSILILARFSPHFTLSSPFTFSISTQLKTQQ
jgi:hypothetical protein